MAAENENGQEKTFDPSPQRIDEYRREGRIPTSRDVGSAAQLVMALVVFPMAGMKMIGAAMQSVRWSIEQSAVGGLDVPTVPSALISVLATFAPSVLTVSLMMAVAAITAGLMQTQFNFATAALAFKLDRINPLARIKQIFSPSKFSMNALLATAKIGTGALVIGAIFADALPGATTLALSPLSAADLFMRDLLYQMLIATTVVLTILAIADYTWQRRQQNQQMMMTREEFVRDQEQTEGKPEYKQRRRQMHRDLSMNRIIEAVPEADVIITNPTHLAIALRYRPGEDKAPRVTARGADALALHIRTIARHHGVPIIENRPLARTLFRRCKAGQFVPDSVYQDVARVLARVYQARVAKNRIQRPR